METSPSGKPIPPPKPKSTGKKTAVFNVVGSNGQTGSSRSPLPCAVQPTNHEKGVEISPQKKSPASTKPVILPKPQLLAVRQHKSPEQAPVAKLDEFETLTPVRPPRSPKNKTFAGGPFANANKPAVPIKKKHLLKSSGNEARTTEPIPAILPSVTERRFKFEVTDAVPVPVARVKVKSASLGRNVEPDVSAWSQPPTRPPRKPRTDHLLPGQPLLRTISLVNSIEEVNKKNIPVYAVVNYNLKKNRRQTIEKNLETTTIASTPLPTEEMKTAEEKCANTDSTDSKQGRSGMEDKLNVGEISSKNDLVVTQFAPDKSDIDIKVVNEVLDEAVEHADKLSDKWSSAEAIEESSSKLEYASAKASMHSSLSDIMPDNLVESEIVQCEDQRADKTFREVDACIGNTNSFPDSKTNCDIVLKPSVSVEIVSPTEVSRELSFQSNNPAMSKVNSKERAKSLPHLDKSNEKYSVAQRHASQWCDEGELSTGVLGDVDSSDAATRQSSTDDIPAEDSVRRKLKSLTNFTKNIIRKSGRKSKDGKTRESSQFHCSITSCESDSLQVEQPCAVPHSESEDEFDDNNVVAEADSNLSEEQKQAHKAFKIAEEIMTSERVFVDVLKLLSVDFRSFVEEANRVHKCPIIPENDLCKILNHLPQILSLSENLLHDLEQRILKWTEIGKISDVIVKKGPFLKLYTTYIQNFQNQSTLLEECCHKYLLFRSVVQDFEGSSRCKKLTLRHYMLKPVQRIPQYRLLLENYIRCLGQSSLDYVDTQTALHIVCEVADHANRTMKEGDDISKLLKLQSLLGHYELIKPGRILRKQGELLKVCRKEMQPRYFILLNDCLLYTTYYGSGLSSGLKVNYEIPLHQMKVNVSSAEDYGNEFSILSVTRSFTLSASSSREMQEWVNALKDAIQEKTNKESTFLNVKLSCVTDFKLGRQAPVWIPDRRVTMCQICTGEFTVTFRRHHCRACGKVVCGDCSANKAPLQYMKFQAARVCNDCFIVLQKDFMDSSDLLPDDLSKKEKEEIIDSAKLLFSKALPVVPKKNKKYVPQRLKEVSANDAGCQMSGWLQRYSRRSWKKLWFVLKEQVLYEYKASEDVVALDSFPVLGYEITFADSEMYEGIDAKLVFMLTHKGQPQKVFHAENLHSTQRWIKAMQEATTMLV